MSPVCHTSRDDNQHCSALASHWSPGDHVTLILALHWLTVTHDDTRLSDLGRQGGAWAWAWQFTKSL